MAVIPVTKGDTTYALFVCGRPDVKDALFLTGPQEEFQVGIFERGTGYEVKPHMHPERETQITQTSEFLYVQEGSAEVTVYDEDWNVLKTQAVKTGDFLVFFRGGHSLTMLQETRLIEVKQGPYPGDGHAKVFQKR